MGERGGTTAQKGVSLAYMIGLRFISPIMAMGCAVPIVSIFYVSQDFARLKEMSFKVPRKYVPSAKPGILA